MTAEVICVGILTLDQVFEVPAIPPAGKVVATAKMQNAGGMAATAAAAIAALGGSSSFWGRLGCDAVGDELAAALTRAGVDTGGLLRCPRGSSPTSAVIKSANGERLIAAYPGSNFDVVPSQLPLHLLVPGCVVLADLRWADAALVSFRTAREAGLQTVLDADVGDREDIRRLAPHCTHAIFSQPGLAMFTGEEDISAGLVIASKVFGGQVAVTLGERGVMWLEDAIERHLPAPTVAPIDTTGAGDVFHGAYALGLAEGMSMQHCMQFASAAAAAKCANGTGWAALPSRSQTMLLMNSCYGNSQ